MSVPLDELEFGGAKEGDLRELATFFVKSFWLASTTFGDGVQLSGGETNQLVNTVSADLGSRYGLVQDKRPRTLRGNTMDSIPLFWKRVIVAREPGGPIVGCVGIEASLFNSKSGVVFRSEMADNLLRTELNAMDDDTRGAMYSESTGIGSLAKLVLAQDEQQLVQKYAASYTPYALLANLAVSPSYRRTGLGSELVEIVEDSCEAWGVDDVLLKVEECNVAARKLYESLGYSQIHRDEEKTALRLSPSTSVMNAFLPIENEDLLTEEPTTLLTLAKHVAE